MHTILATPCQSRKEQYASTVQHSVSVVVSRKTTSADWECRGRTADLDDDANDSDSFLFTSATHTMNNSQ
jgi:hypothetical protein